jgi:predicted GIY-YIG superfamily endonuclease
MTPRTPRTAAHGRPPAAGAGGPHDPLVGEGSRPTVEDAPPVVPTVGPDVPAAEEAGDTLAEERPVIRGVTWQVYRLYNAEKELLYVGHTRWLTRRLGEHRRLKTWWPDVTATVLDNYETEDEARLRERAIWKAEIPRYNKLSPFRTVEDVRAYRRYQMSPEARERQRASNRVANMTPEAAERKRARARATGPMRDRRVMSMTPEQRERERARDRRRKVAARRQRASQSGPGLF